MYGSIMGEGFLLIYFYLRTGSNGLILTYRVSLNANNSVKKTLETKLKNWGVLVNLKYWLGIIFNNFQ